MTASGVVNAAPGSRRQAKASGWMPMRRRVVPNEFDLRLGQEVAGVDEAEAVGLAGVLGRRCAAQGEERAVLGAAHAAQAPDRLAAVDEGPVVDVPLPGPRPAEGHEVPVGVGQVEDGRHRASHDERRRAAVDERERARDDRAVREQRRPHGDPQARRRIDQVDLERLGLVVRLGVGRGQVGQVRLAGEDPMVGVSQVQHGRAVRALHDQRRDAEVADAGHGDLEPDGLADPVRVAREVSRSEMPQGAAGSHGRPGVEVAQPAVLEHAHREADAAVLQVPLAGGGVPVDGHAPAASSLSVHAQR